MTAVAATPVMDSSADDPIVVGATSEGYVLIKEVVEQYERHDGISGRIQAVSKAQSGQRMVAGDYHVLVRGGMKRGNWIRSEHALLERRFGGADRVPEFMLGRVVLHVFVNNRNRVQSLTLKELEK